MLRPITDITKAWSLSKILEDKEEKTEEVEEERREVLQEREEEREGQGQGEGDRFSMNSKEFRSDWSFSSASNSATPRSYLRY
jgi:hypothetical protein